MRQGAEVAPGADRDKVGRGPPPGSSALPAPTARTGPVHPHTLLAPPPQSWQSLPGTQGHGVLALSPRPSHSPGSGTKLSAEQGQPGWGDRGKHTGEEQVLALHCGNQPARTGMGRGIHRTTWSWHGEKGKLRHGRVKVEHCSTVRTGTGMLLQHPMIREGQEQGTATHQSSRRCREWRGQR